MVMNSYTSRLTKVFANFDYANQRVATQRKYLTAAEDPGSTARGYQLRKSFQQTNDYINNVQDVLDSMDTIDASIRVLSDMAANIHAKLLESKNDTWSSDEREIFANEILSMQKQAVDSLNAKFDDKFLFGGSSTKKLPFEFDQENQVLKYRGIDVTTTDPAEQAQLKAWSNEKIFVDIGFGLDVKVDASGNPTVAENSAFNTSIPGIGFLTKYNNSNVDTTNPENNFILLLGVIAKTITQEPYDQQKTGELALQLSDMHKDVLLAVTKKGADYNFLQQRQDVLKKNSDDINSKLLNVEFINMEEAIGDMKMADTTYRAVLEMGSRILPPSFIDFMK